ncbi:hypothetical protein [Megasphaera cerevisiae]|nr:hypothetical protein [Megasphaera cerevisiae]
MISNENSPQRSSILSLQAAASVGTDIGAKTGTAGVDATFVFWQTALRT